MSASKAEDFKAPLATIQEVNPDCDGVLLFWDNARADKKRAPWAWQQNSFTIPLATYSPDLNPVQRVWKSCKRWVNQQKFAKKKEQLQELFQQAFEHYKVQISFAESWIKKRESIFSCYNTNFNANIK